jgi:hypothetical protein
MTGYTFLSNDVAINKGLDSVPILNDDEEDLLSHTESTLSHIQYLVHTADKYI